MTGERNKGTVPRSKIFEPQWNQGKGKGMTSEELFTTLKSRFIEVLKTNGIEKEPVQVTCRSLSPEEAIGTPGRQDFPILSGRDVMIQAEFRGCRGQAFTDAPASFSGTLSEILEMDLVHDAYARGLFVAVMNAVMESLGLCKGTVHCRSEGPELCSQKMKAWLAEHRPDVKKTTLVGYQPALLDMLSRSGYQVRVLDLNPQNIGQVRCGVTVEDGVSAMQSAIGSADLILCTGSTLCNGTIVDYIMPEKDVLFFGTSAAGAAELLHLNRVCFAHELQ